VTVTDRDVLRTMILDHFVSTKYGYKLRPGDAADAILASDWLAQVKATARAEGRAEAAGAICWDTTCLNCAKVLDSAYAETVRAEKAEAQGQRDRSAMGQWRRLAQERLDRLAAHEARADLRDSTGADQ
jgi:hypothetical protein